MIKSRRIRWTEHVARMGVKRDAYRILMGKSEGKRPLGRLDIGGKMYLTEIGWGGMDWIDPAQWRALVNTVMYLRVP
jgi:hypothetical protein